MIRACGQMLLAAGLLAALGCGSTEPGPLSDSQKQLIKLEDYRTSVAESAVDAQPGTAGKPAGNITGRRQTEDVIEP